jgi:hypothetical protein
MTGSPWRRTGPASGLCSGLGLHLLQSAGHLRMHGVDGLEWPDHHPELDDAAGVVAPDDVDAVDVLPVDGGLEFETAVSPSSTFLV